MFARIAAEVFVLDLSDRRTIGKTGTISGRILQAQSSSIVPWIRPFTNASPNQLNQSLLNSDDRNLIKITLNAAITTETN